MSDKLDEIIRDKARQSADARNQPSDFRGIFEFFFNEDGILAKTRISPAKRNMLHVYNLMHQKHPEWGLEKASKTLAMLFISEDGPDNSRRQGIELFRGLLSQLRNESVNIEAGNQNGSNNLKP